MLPLNFCGYLSVDGLQRVRGLEQSMDHTLSITAHTLSIPAQGRGWQTMTMGQIQLTPCFLYVL